MAGGGYDPYSGEPVPVNWGQADETASTPSDQQAWVNPISPSLSTPASPTFFTTATGPQSRRRQSKRWWWIVPIAVVVSLVAGGVYFATQLLSDAKQVSDTFTEQDAKDRPALRKVQPVSVLGPTWAPGDDTYTMKVKFWPFAFRTPRDFDCFDGGPADGLPDAETEECKGKAGLLYVVHQECDHQCSAAERKKLNVAWMGKKGKVERSGQQTYYQQLKRGKNGRYPGKSGKYKATLTHYCGKPPHTFVAVYIEANTEHDKPAMQKTLNDIVTQCG